MVYQDFLVSVLTEASRIATSFFGQVRVTSKPNDQNQVLTEADLSVGKFIIGEIEKSYSSYNIIDEEKGGIDKKSQYTWVIDPIDGTSNFASGVPTYGIMLGLLKDGKPIAGGISLPFFDEIYIAESGQGVFCNGKSIHVSSETELSKVLLAYGIDGDRSHPEKVEQYVKITFNLVNQVRNIRTSHSCYDLMQVAKGNYGGIIDFNSYKIWDHVAAASIIQEAGGIYTDFDGSALEFNHPLTKLNDYYGVCAAAPILYEKLHKLIVSYHVE